jgi:hypothetical protein
MRRQKLPLCLLCLTLALGVAAVPAFGLGTTPGSGSEDGPRPARPAADDATRELAKKRCKKARPKANGAKKRVCKKRKPRQPATYQPPVGPPPPPPSAPGYGGGASGGGGGGGEPEYQPPTEPPAEPPSQFERVDLISDNGFEDPAQPTGCFEPFNVNDGAVAGDAGAPIAGANSLSVSVSRFGRVGCIHEYPFGAGPIGEAVTVQSRVRIDAPATGEGLKVCVVFYFANDPADHKACRTLPLSDHSVADVEVSLGAEGKRLQRVFFQLEAGSTAVEATLDEAHLYVDQLKGSEGGGGGGGGGDDGGGGGGGGSNAGRFAAMVSPTDGETFTTPLDLRLVGVGHDPNIPTNEPEPGRGINAAKVEFLLDGVKVLEQDGSDAEYHVFKGFAEDLGVAPGEHTVVARATYVNPDRVIESDPVTITVAQPPAYAQTVNLTQDVILGTNQSFELIGAPGGRIRLNGNGHRIVSPTGTSGKVTLKHVDVYDLGNPASTAAPGIDVTTTGTTGSVAIENSIFDGSNPVELRFDGSSTATLTGNLFRSNMRMPIGQQPGSDASSPTVPVISISGTSAVPKTFAGNNVGAAPVLFDRVNRWTIGGDTDAESNVLIGPRASFEVLGSSNVNVEGNFIDHTYYGGWSQGQLLELHGSDPITVRHNVLVDSSWPVRGLGGEFAYNLVVEAGHQWMVPADGAHVHHNLFVGGDNDVGGITGYYDISARIENNTFDGLLGGLVHSAINWQNGETTLRSNAFVGFPTWSTAVVDRQGGTVDAGFNGFFNPEPNNYTGGLAPTTDLGGGAQTNPRFAGPLPTETFHGDKVAVWNRGLRVSQILAGYRARYTPTLGSAYIDSGDPAGGTGNDVGAIGAGAVNPLDRFGSFAQPGWIPPPTPPSP